MRMQVMILIGIGSVILLLLCYFGLSSLLAQRAQTHLQLEAATDQMDKINREIKALPDLRRSRDDLFWAIQQAATNYILFHEYRNYHLTARETLLPMAAALNITIDIPREGGVADFPIPESKVTDRLIRVQAKSPGGYSGAISSTFGLYSVTLTGQAGFVPLLAFIRRMEESNPYLTVTDLSVKANASQPEAHSFTLTVLWPIWKNLELKPKPEDLIFPAQDYDAPETL
jgi:hypothetical protein